MFISFYLLSVVCTSHIFSGSLDVTSQSTASLSDLNTVQPEGSTNSSDHDNLPTPSFLHPNNTGPKGTTPSGEIDDFTGHAIPIIAGGSILFVALIVGIFKICSKRRKKGPPATFDWYELPEEQPTTKVVSELRASRSAGHRASQASKVSNVAGNRASRMSGKRGSRSTGAGTHSDPGYEKTSSLETAKQSGGSGGGTH